MDDATAQPVLSASAVLAGSVFACDVVLLMFIEPISIILEHVPDIDPGLVVDDLSLQSSGSEEKVKQDVTTATTIAIEELSEAGFLISKARISPPPCQLCGELRNDNSLFSELLRLTAYRIILSA